MASMMPVFGCGVGAAVMWAYRWLRDSVTCSTPAQPSVGQRSVNTTSSTAQGLCMRIHIAKAMKPSFNAKRVHAGVFKTLNESVKGPRHSTAQHTEVNQQHCSSCVKRALHPSFSRCGCRRQT